MTLRHLMENDDLSRLNISELNRQIEQAERNKPCSFTLQQEADYEDDLQYLYELKEIYKKNHPEYRED